jgi:hypothetical protein
MRPANANESRWHGEEAGWSEAVLEQPASQELPQHPLHDRSQRPVLADGPPATAGSLRELSARARSSAWAP